MTKKHHESDAPQRPIDMPEDAAIVEPPGEAVARLEREVGELQDRYLRLAAEFDNFKKRVARERTETWGKAQADVLQRLGDALEDLARFAHVDPATTDAKTIHDGVDLVERKIWKELDAVGVRRLDETGGRFDPAVHEAVTVAPAATPEQDNTVGQVLQAGYPPRGPLIPPARGLGPQGQGTPGPGGGRGGGAGGGGRMGPP